MGLFGSNKVGKATQGVAENISKMAQQYGAEGDALLLQGRNDAAGYLNQIQGLYQPLSQLGQQGAGLYADAMGLNGADGAARAQGAFTTGPGYQFNMDQGLQALERRAAAQGRMQSGQTGLDTLTFAQGLAGQEYNNWLGGLSGYNDMMLAGANGQAQGLGSLGNLYYGNAQDRLGVKGDMFSGVAEAGKMWANAEEQRQASKQQGIGSLFGLGTKILGGALGGIGGGPAGMLAGGLSGLTGYGR